METGEQTPVSFFPTHMTNDEIMRALYPLYNISIFFLILVYERNKRHFRHYN